MRLLRARAKLWTGMEFIDKNSVFPDYYLSDKVIEKLLANRVISIAQTPPLNNIKGWEARSERLSNYGVNTIEEFLEMTDAELKKIYKSYSLATFEGWRKELLGMLQPKTVKG